MRRAAAFLGLAVLILAPAILAQQSGGSYSTCGPGRECVVRSVRITNDAGIRFADGTRLNTAGGVSLWSSSTDGGIYRLGGVSVGGISAGSVNVDGGDLLISAAGAVKHSLSPNGTGYLNQSGGLLTVGGQVDARSGLTNAGSSDTSIGLLGRGNSASTVWVQVRAENSGTRSTVDGGKIQAWSNTETAAGNIAWIDNRGTFGAQAIQLGLADGGYSLSVNALSAIGWLAPDGGSPRTWTRGPSYADVYLNSESGTSINLDSAGTYYDWTSSSVGVESGFPYATGGTVGAIGSGSHGAGDYRVSWHASVRAGNFGTQSATIDVRPSVSAVALGACQNDATLAANQTSRTALAGSCFVSLVAGDVITLAFSSNANSSVLSLHHVNLNVERLR